MYNQKNKKHKKTILDHLGEAIISLFAWAFLGGFIWLVGAIAEGG